jgi:hypothetical protein
LSVAPFGGATTPVVLGAVVDGWSGPKSKTDDVDVSILSERWKTFLPGQVDPGTFEAIILYSPEDTDTTETLATMLQNGTSGTFTVTYADIQDSAGDHPAVTKTFVGYVSGWDQEVKKNEAIRATVTIKLSQNPGIL